MSKARSVDLELNETSHPWEYPNCPECHRHIYVDRSKHDLFDFICHKCGYFQTPPRYKLREELR